MFKDLLEVLYLWYNEAGEAELLIKWAGLPDCENSWESFFVFTPAFPHFHLQNKVKAFSFVVGEGSVISRPVTEQKWSDRGAHLRG